MASINDLDNPLLVLILNRLCIQKLFTAGHVCVRWNAMRDMSVSERKELLLMVGNDAKRYIEESGFQIPEKQLLVNENGDAMFPDQSDVQLKIYSFPLDSVLLLFTQFTKLTTLTISTRLNSNELDSIIHFLEQFNRPNGTLRTLKLYLNWDYSVQHHPELIRNQTLNIHRHQRLFSTVNSIGSLRQLVFDVNKEFVDDIDLPILAQLEEFEFNSNDEFDCLCDLITRYAVNNPQLRRIGINIQTFDFDWLLALSTELSSRFTHLNIFLSVNDKYRFADMCHNFSNLTSLEMCIDEMFHSIVRQFRALAHLTNLISLFININGPYLTQLSPARREIMNFVLPSVKVFTIHITGTIRSHNFFHACALNGLFPNVQVVRVILMNANCCSYCQKKLNESTECTDAIRMALEQHCARQMFRHFTHCQHLRMIYTNVRTLTGTRCRKWAWGELGPFEEEEEHDGEYSEDGDDEEEEMTEDEDENEDEEE